MFKNYLKIAWRNIIHNKVYSALNILGLSAGMAIALMIGLWVHDQYSYDRFLPNYKQLYQVKMNLTTQHEGTNTQNAVSLPLSDVLRSDITGIKNVAETDWVGTQTHGLMIGDKKLYLTGGTVASNFLTMFRYPLVRGNATNALKDPFSIVVNQSTAKALFGDQDPINKVISIDNRYDVKVTAVIRDIPATSSFTFNYILPISFSEQTQPWIKVARTEWTNNSFQIFIELLPGITAAQVNARIKDIVAKQSTAMRVAKPQLFLHPMQQWHLYSDFKNGKPTGGFIDYVRMFTIIGLLVLLIACINFMNLSTARSEKRAREVGVRKAVGSKRSDLIFQFLIESFLITIIASVFALVFVQLALPSFNTLTAGVVHIPYANPVFWLIMIGYVFITGLLAGSRPALYLSSFKPVKVLKGSLQIGKAASLPRKALVVVQFSCSVALIISTIIVYQQIQYAKNRPTGYIADRLVSTDLSIDLAKNYTALKNELTQNGLIEDIATASSPATGVYSHMSLTHWPGKSAAEEAIDVGRITVSDEYFKTLGIKFLAGSDFPNGPDSTSIIINEATARRLGLKNPLNQIINWNGINKPARIRGVVKDALMESPFTPVAPAVYNHGNRVNTIIYRLAKNVNTHDAMEKITSIFNKYNPAYPFTYSFVDEDYNSKFNLEVLVGKLAGIFASLAIFISCLGLFGLAAYMAEQRTKEIGVRKVLGASVSQVWLLLSGDFVLLVIISCVIASPVALYFLHNWLQKYDYRITIGPGVFLLSTFLALVITLLTVSFQSIKAALINPVKSLRSE